VEKNESIVKARAAALVVRAGKKKPKSVEDLFGKALEACYHILSTNLCRKGKKQQIANKDRIALLALKAKVASDVLDRLVPRIPEERRLTADLVSLMKAKKLRPAKLDETIHEIEVQLDPGTLKAIKVAKRITAPDAQTALKEASETESRRRGGAARGDTTPG